MIIHDRDAHDDIMAILRSDGAGTRGVMHSFSGDLAMAEECLARGYHDLAVRPGDVPEGG